MPTKREAVALPALPNLVAKGGQSKENAEQ